MTIEITRREAVKRAPDARRHNAAPTILGRLGQTRTAKIRSGVQALGDALAL